MEMPLSRESGVVRAITRSPEEERVVLANFADALKNQPLSSFERPKTLEEIETINEILLRIPEFVSTYGGQAVQGISANNFHFTDKAKLSDNVYGSLAEANVGGFYDFEHQAAVILPENRSSLVTAQRVLHELLHFESFTAMQQPMGSHTDKASSAAVSFIPRRIGFSIFDETHSRRFFRDLDEAMIEILAARFDDQYFDRIPALAPDLERRRSLRNMVEQAPQEIAAVFSRQEGDGRWETVIEKWRFKEQRERLNALLGEIYTRNKSRFTSEEQVFAMFARAVFTGRLLEIARIVEHTFGPGSFRELGEDTMLEGEEPNEENR